MRCSPPRSPRHRRRWRPQRCCGQSPSRSRSAPPTRPGPQLLQSLRGALIDQTQLAPHTGIIEAART
eukprot:15369539-Alexandrium_andersonii.AAC.1